MPDSGISYPLALWLRRAGKRADAARQLQDALRGVATMKLNLSLLLLIVLAFAASLLAGRVWLPPRRSARAA